MSEITQADREVAAEILKFAGMWSLALRVRAGKCDDNVTVECIARHRHEARKGALEEAAGIADAYSDMCAGSDQPETQGACEGAAGAATAIRSAVGGE